jgi:hypothetical protein
VWLALPVALVVSGCATSQQEAARLRAQKIMQMSGPFEVTRSNPDVQVTGIEVLRSRSRSALVVHVRNLMAHPQIELPISVGVVRPDGKRVLLNGSADAPFFAAHVPSIAARESVTWVLSAAGAIAAGQPFAEVGLPSRPPITDAQTLPTIVPSAQVSSGPRVVVSVHNRSSTPQEDLQVYLVALRNGQAVGAATGQLAKLAAGAASTLQLPVMGTLSGATIELEALPTIFD